MKVKRFIRTKEKTKDIHYFKEIRVRDEHIPLTNNRSAVLKKYFIKKRKTNKTSVLLRSRYTGTYVCKHVSKSTVTLTRSDAFYEHF